MDVTMWKEFGLQGILMCAVVTILFFVIKCTLATTKDILSQLYRITEAFNTSQSHWADVLKEHTEQSRSFHEEVRDANKYQREEHLKMLENQVKICNCLEQTEKTLGRINGYTETRR